MGGGGGGSQPADTSQTIRYAPYIETRHSNFLETVYNTRVSIIGSSPFSEYTDIIIDDAFFGAGYTIASFPSLYDMYGKFMAGLDIEALWAQIYESTLEASAVNTLVSAENDLLEDEIEENALPRLQVGLRDINSVISSSYIVAKSLIDSTKTKLVSKFSADLKYQLIPIAQRRWEAHLDWNKTVVSIYAELMKFYFSAKIDVDEVNYAMAAKNLLWPFTVLDFERAALGALQGATNSKSDVAGASTASRVIGGALTGAAMGAMVGGSIKGTAGSVGVTGGTAAVGTAGQAGYVAATPGSYAGVGAGIGAVLGAASAWTY